MFVVARLPDPNRAAELKSKGLKAKAVKNAVICQLPPYNPEDPDSPVWTLPGVLKEATLLIDCAEAGGLVEQGHGIGTVIAGVTGKALRPYYVPKRMQAETAFFAVMNKVCTVTAWQDGVIRISKHEIESESSAVWVETTEIWAGRLTRLPRKLKRFKAAAEAAVEKANTPGPDRGVSFVDGLPWKTKSKT